MCETMQDIIPDVLCETVRSTTYVRAISKLREIAITNVRITDVSDLQQISILHTKNLLESLRKSM
jgi:hypothetical protein